MKKLIIIFLLLQPGLVKSQVYFTSLNFPVVGTTISIYNCDTTGVPVPVTGLGQTFNYTSLNTTSVNFNSYIEPDSLWCSDLFPGATLVWQRNNADWFYKQETDTLRFLGNCLSDSTATGTFNSFYYKPAVDLFTGMNYLQVYMDSAHFQYGSGVFRNQITYFQVMADGVLNLPSASYANVHVLRKEVFVKDHDDGSEEEHHLSYLFYDSSLAKPVLEISFLSVFGDPLGFKKVTYFDVGIGVKEQTTSRHINAYPNPFTDRVFIEGFSDKEVYVYDSHLMPVPFSKTVRENGFEICVLPNSTTGVYFVVMCDHGQRYVRKIIKI
ncbi:MAG TPA: T9SS type A sorting domain-containing protein [Flavobacteriales bacterium]|nr:T9SS type A sorting domain-containing protein [Flavobacteriales bacterium]